LNAVSFGEGSMNSLSIPLHRTHFDTSQWNLVSECGFGFWALFDASFGGVISELQCWIGKSWANRDTYAIVALGNDIAVVPCRTLENALFRHIICKHIVVSIVDSWIWAERDANSFIVKIFSVLVCGTVSGLNTCPCAVCTVSWDGVGWAYLNANPQLEISVLPSAINSVCVVARIFTLQSVIVTKLIEWTLGNTKLLRHISPVHKDCSQGRTPRYTLLCSVISDVLNWANQRAVCWNNAHVCIIITVETFRTVFGISEAFPADSFSPMSRSTIRDTKIVNVSGELAKGALLFTCSI
jgi:hypothetical protein